MSSHFFVRRALSDKLRDIRQERSLSLQQVADLMHVSKSYVYQVEQGKTPSAMYLDLFFFKFGVDADEFFSNLEEGNSIEGKSKKYFGALLAGTSLAAPLAPLAAGAIAAGVGLSTIIFRIRDAYGAKSEQELAEKMGLGKNAISNWKAKNKIPEKVIIQAANETKLPIPWLLAQTEDFYVIIGATITVLENIIQKENYILSPEKKSKLSVFLIKEFISNGRVDEERIKTLLELTAR